MRGRFGVYSLSRLAALASVAVLALGAAGCGAGSDGSDGDNGESSTAGSDLSGAVRIDGSSIVARLTEAIAEGFQRENPGVTVTIGTVGTGAGFEELCAGRIDIGDAAWPIDRKARGLCKHAGVAYTGISVAFDVLAALVNEENPVSCLTLTQLGGVWNPASTISNWSEIRDLKEEFDEELVLFAPGTESGTFEYFSEATDGVAGGSRTDFTEVDDDDAMFAGVAGAPGGTGYSSLFPFLENGDAVKALEVDSGEGCVAPSVETAQDRSYSSLSRPNILYLNEASLKKPAVKAFVDYYLENAGGIAESVDFAPLTAEQLKESEAEVAKAAAG